MEILTFIMMCGLFSAVTMDSLDTTSSRLVNGVLFTHENSVGIAMRHWIIAFQVTFEDIDLAANSLLEGINYLKDHNTSHTPIDVSWNSTLITYWDTILHKQQQVTILLANQFKTFKENQSS